jgi:outer membrane cobalamin receptor
MSRFLGAFAVATLTTATIVSAQTTTPEVVVTAQGLEEQLPEQLEEYGTRVSRISRDQVQNGSYADIAQSLQALAPGLYIQPKNGPFDYADISLLGSRTDDVLWLVDGVRINNRLYSGTPPNDTLPSSIVERLEVLEGGQSLFYGTGAVAGAINLVTHAFSDTPRGGLTLTGDTNDTIHADGYYSTAFGRNQVVLFASKDDSDGYESFRREDYQPSATDRDRGYDVLTLGGKYAFNFTDELRLSASYFNTDADLDFSQPYRLAFNVNSREERLGTLKLDYLPSEDVGLYLKGYYHWWHTDYTTVYNDLATPGALNVVYDDAFWGFDDRGINALARFSFSKGVEYYAGYDFQRYGGRDEVLFIAPTKEETQAVFAEVRTTPDLLPNTHFAAGVRHNSPDVGQDATVWHVRGQYELPNDMFIKGTVGTNFRLPTAEELFADDPFFERGNPDLKPERSKSLNLSVGGTVSNGATAFYWELVGFARDIEDLIDYEVFDPVTNQDVFGNVDGTVKVRGGELSLSTSGPSLSSRLAFTHARSRQDGGLQTLRVPEDILKASLDYHPPNLPFGLSAAVNYTGDVFTRVTGSRINYGKYTIVDISGRYFLDAERRHRLNLSLQNAVDEELGRPAQGCIDDPADGPFDCSTPYTYTNLGLPRTLRASYSYAF